MKLDIVVKGRTEKIVGVHKRMKVRMGVMPTKIIGSKLEYKRKNKHPSRTCDDVY